MNLLVVVFGLIIALFLHELAHGIEMHRKGIPIAEAGLGLPLSFLPRLKFKIGNFPAITLNLIIIGAYVRPTEEGKRKLESLSRSEQAEIFGAGIIANLAFAASLVVAIAVAFGSPLTVGGYAVAFAPVVIWRFRKIFCRYLIPVLGILVFFLVSAGLVFGWLRLTGPIGLISRATEIMSAFEALVFVALISLSIGLINMIPLVPLDGGQILFQWLRGRFGDRFGEATKIFSAAVVMLAILIVFLLDFLRLF